MAGRECSAALPADRPQFAAETVVQAINRIFRGALSARSLDDLRTLILSIAQEVTGAGFSRLVEVEEGDGHSGPWPISDGRRTGTFDPPPYPVTGIPLDAIERGQTVIINQPGIVRAADWVDERDGALDNFMGVPLMVDDAVVGLVCLGNRPGGFDDTHRQTVEELAPAILQALRSKRAECVSRDSRRRLESLLGGIPQLVWIAAEGGLWTWAAPQWAAYTGLTRAASVGMGWLHAVHPEDRESACDFWRRAGDSGTLEMEGRLWHAEEGRYRWFRFQAHPVRADHGAITEWFGTCTDIDDMRCLQDRQRMLVAELQHRVRNILTVVRSVFARTVATGGTVEDVADHFRGRLDALARTYVVLTNNAAGLVDLESLIRDELLGFGVSGEPVATIKGPAIMLDSRTAEAMSLAVHELATNAVKYGALDGKNGHLTVRWATNLRYDGCFQLVLDWLEEGVPAVSVAPQRYGFGRELIEKALPYQLGAKTSLEFRGGGVRCTMKMVLPPDARSMARREHG